MLGCHTIIANDCTWISSQGTFDLIRSPWGNKIHCQVKYRYRSDPVDCTVQLLEKGGPSRVVEIKLSSIQFGVAEGQVSDHHPHFYFFMFKLHLFSMLHYTSAMFVSEVGPSSKLAAEFLTPPHPFFFLD